MSEFQELFTVGWSGNKSDLRDGINSLNGVVSVSVKSDHEVLTGEVDVEIKYDSHITDRTQLMDSIEDFAPCESVIAA